MPKAKYWCCPTCELLCPMHQRTCGVCGREQSVDIGRLDFAEAMDFQKDAAFFRATRTRDR